MGQDISYEEKKIKPREEESLAGELGIEEQRMVDVQIVKKIIASFEKNKSRNVLRRTSKTQRSLFRYYVETARAYFREFSDLVENRPDVVRRRLFESEYANQEKKSNSVFPNKNEFNAATDRKMDEFLEKKDVFKRQLEDLIESATDVFEKEQEEGMPMTLVFIVFLYLSEISCFDFEAAQSRYETRSTVVGEYDVAKVGNVYPFPNYTGLFAYEVYVTAYAHGIDIIGIPLLLSTEYDNMISCSFSFVWHDLQHQGNVGNVKMWIQACLKIVEAMDKAPFKDDEELREAVFFTAFVRYHEQRYAGIFDGEMPRITRVLEKRGYINVVSRFAESPEERTFVTTENMDIYKRKMEPLLDRIIESQEPLTGNAKGRNKGKEKSKIQVKEEELEEEEEEEAPQKKRGKESLPIQVKFEKYEEEPTQGRRREGAEPRSSSNQTLQPLPTKERLKMLMEEGDWPWGQLLLGLDDDSDMARLYMQSTSVPRLSWFDLLTKMFVKTPRGEDGKPFIHEDFVTGLQGNNAYSGIARAAPWSVPLFKNPWAPDRNERVSMLCLIVSGARLADASEITKSLLACGARVALGTSDIIHLMEQPPVYNRLQYGNLSIVEILIRYNADAAKPYIEYAHGIPFDPSTNYTIVFEKYLETLLYTENGYKPVSNRLLQRQLFSTVVLSLKHFLSDEQVKNVITKVAEMWWSHPLRLFVAHRNQDWWNRTYDPHRDQDLSVLLDTAFALPTQVQWLSPSACFWIATSILQIQCRVVSFPAHTIGSNQIQLMTQASEVLTTLNVFPVWTDKLKAEFFDCHPLRQVLWALLDYDNLRGDTGHGWLSNSQFFNSTNFRQGYYTKISLPYLDAQIVSLETWRKWKKYVSARELVLAQFHKYSREERGLEGGENSMPILVLDMMLQEIMGTGPDVPFDLVEYLKGDEN
jgi:hypothetical protein